MPGVEPMVRAEPSRWLEPHGWVWLSGENEYVRVADTWLAVPGGGMAVLAHKFRPVETLNSGKMRNHMFRCPCCPVTAPRNMGRHIKTHHIRNNRLVITDHEHHLLDPTPTTAGKSKTSSHDILLCVEQARALAGLPTAAPLPQRPSLHLDTFPFDLAFDDEPVPVRASHTPASLSVTPIPSMELSLARGSASSSAPPSGLSASASTSTASHAAPPHSSLLLDFHDLDPLFKFGDHSALPRGLASMGYPTEAPPVDWTFSAELDPLPLAMATVPSSPGEPTFDAPETSRFVDASRPGELASALDRIASGAGHAQSPVRVRLTASQPTVRARVVVAVARAVAASGATLEAISSQLAGDSRRMYVCVDIGPPLARPAALAAALTSIAAGNLEADIVPQEPPLPPPAILVLQRYVLAKTCSDGALAHFEALHARCAALLGCVSAKLWLEPAPGPHANDDTPASYVLLSSWRSRSAWQRWLAQHNASLLPTIAQSLAGPVETRILNSGKRKRSADSLSPAGGLLDDGLLPPGKRRSLLPHL
ncbi:uncharacterized protein AMSG_08229 [Thecamonas trahens ATCC 50062]|uniref:ABM domain-containing protein n=1 Tax=Thecamonas trahens ATCC 50062 TaxID=461836 RepID=A0A0L0DHY3_THETB|nr:hypothetical protein AMSG_08229 [Thecamonas trahens ATCC 50062]KNC51979.1 hypothetical protein AMSG_08229 [Thecamonas trahens ATCC 50062]|eukprot:XP_013755565.1 hypothetical protein AMSG_08229 [Thecamonas trahens ATCC 50062]